MTRAMKFTRSCAVLVAMPAAMIALLSGPVRATSTNAMPANVTVAAMLPTSTAGPAATQQTWTNSFNFQLTAQTAIAKKAPVTGVNTELPVLMTARPPNLAATTVKNFMDYDAAASTATARDQTASTNERRAAMRGYQNLWRIGEPTFRSANYAMCARGGGTSFTGTMT